MTDLHYENDLLQNYELFVNVGHSEYWSKEMRDNVEQFISSGGNAAFFAGNVCWWQVRMKDNGNTIVCYKRRDLDPVHDHRPPPGNTTTVNWDTYPVNRSSTTLTGVKYSGSDFVDTDPAHPPYTVMHGVSNHWIFANTGLSSTNEFGKDPVSFPPDPMGNYVVGPETDVQVGDSPSAFEPLARMKDNRPPLHPSNKVIATMGAFKRGGTVFTASTMNWTLGLTQPQGSAVWGPIDQITLNVLRRLGNLP
jgi:hypothetical protein